MALGSESLRYEATISDSQVSDRIDYLAFLDDPESSHEGREFWEDEIEELKELRELVKDIGSEFGTIISEGFWETYAAQEADESFDLEKSGAYKYFNYDSYADDLQTDYSQVKFGDDTYYYA